MYFIPQNNRLYSWVAHTKPRIRYLISIFLIGFVAVFWWYAHAWLQVVIEINQQEIVALEKQCVHSNQASDACQQLQKSVPDLQERIRLCTTSNVEEELRMYMIFVMEQAQGAGLLVHNYFADKEVSKDWYVRSVGRYHFQGTLDQIINFLTALTSAQKMIKCDQIHLTNVTDTHFDVMCQLHVMAVKKCVENLNPST